jgi:hypothetical protein
MPQDNAMISESEVVILNANSCGQLSRSKPAQALATKLTFGEPVKVPGRVLEAEMYSWFNLADSPSDRNIVEMWNAGRTHLIRTILAIPDYRMQPIHHLRRRNPFGLKPHLNQDSSCGEKLDG